MADNKTNKTQKEVKVNGNKFVLQHPGARWYIKLQDRITNRFGVQVQEKYLDELLEYVVVKPQGLSLDSFGPGQDYNMSTFNGVMEEVESFLNS